jgi:hypothetical protein
MGKKALIIGIDGVPFGLITQILKQRYTKGITSR